jgi:hypothetical protein
MLSAERCILLVLIAERASQVASFAAGVRAWNVGVRHSAGVERWRAPRRLRTGRLLLPPLRWSPRVVARSSMSGASWRAEADAKRSSVPSGSAAPPVLCFTHWSP